MTVLKPLGRWMCVLAVLILAGCIPSGSSDGTPASPPPPELDPAVGQQVARQLPAAQDGPSGITTTTNAPAGKSPLVSQPLTVAVQLTPLSGQPGFSLTGKYGFKGTLTPANPEATEWTLKAEFTFESSGYEVGIPSVIPLVTAYVSQTSVKMPPPGEAYLLTIPLTPPAAPPAAKAAVTVPVTARITAPRNAKFTVVISQG